MAARKIPLINRFWNKVNQQGPVVRAELGPCWEWTANRLKGRGYGLIKDDNRKMMRAHRIAWMLCHGPIKNDLWILHKCDNPPCVRPDHLYAGTREDNTRDAIQRDRLAHNRGENAGTVILNNSKVTDIRSRYATGEITQTQLARLYGVTPSTISNVITRKRWFHIP
jgi:hypothetical protein